MRPFGTTQQTHQQPCTESTSSKKPTEPSAKRTRENQPDRDPFGRDQHSPGAKLDHGKPRAGLVLRDFGRALIAVSEIGTFGAKKYSEHGWLEVPNGQERYTDAMLRHVLAPDEHDDESGMLHMAHAAWCALAALELKLRSQRVTTSDDY